jgi:hypothetical protein
MVEEVVTVHHREWEAALTAHRHELEGTLTAEINRAIKAVHEVEFRSRRDLVAAGEREAAASSERFAQEAMPTACTFDHPIATLEHALSLATAEGMALDSAYTTVVRSP